MTVKEKQARLLPLFEKLTALTHERIPEDQLDPRLKGLAHLPRGTLFSCFHEEHLEEATHLYEILFGAKDFEDFMILAKQAHDLVNEGLFVYAISVAILHREDCHGVVIPPIEEIFPDRFVSAETINHAVKEAANHPDKDIVVKSEETGNILDEEYKLAYFREDVGANAHHWHWHIVYPATWKPLVMKQTKDRKGELFYYMHQQMCARYDCERLSIGLQRMIPFHNFEEPLEGYAPHLTSLVSGLNYASRPEGFSLRDLKDVDVQEMIRWRERILEGIHLGYVIDSTGTHIPLDKDHGADILGALIESSYESKNAGFYGSLHNWGHVMMARVHDPDGRFQENPGVMSDTSTSIRDPIFYRYHRFVDNIFQDFKLSLNPYTKEELDFPGIEVVNVTVTAKVPNLVTTYLKEAELELHHGIDFGTTHSVKAAYKHLDHEPFAYNISVENKTGGVKTATVRIFLAPKHDELGNLLEPDDQRRLAIELDKFVYELAAGKNVIAHDHRDSSVTVSKIYTFSQIQAGEGVHEDGSESCSCGWPEHMLLPRGNFKGMEFHLFVILTDHDQDAVEGATTKGSCADAFSYCGVKDHKYPDSKAMGFPFDRHIVNHDIHGFLPSNASVTEVKIKFTG
uniref:Hemocyanin subunit e n=1 Tax=Euphrynichus bacillifer TaxID=317672 RepID=G8YZR5_9ARAC|nr:hemocyanin subunit e [Euphrynichus bacillifer]